MIINSVLDGRLRQLEDAVAAALPATGRLGVAFSAGVDSTVLLALSARTLGTANVLAITGVSESLAARELADARAIAQLIGVRLIEVETGEVHLPDYRRNALDRCFHCKDTLFRAIDDEILRQHRIDAVAYGETADDA
jgi:pyridinium-3,5-biscarboxylic acid mononucleotide sulfurtransferase